MKKGFHVTPCIMWQVRSQLSGWCNLAIFIGCGAQLVHEGSSPAKVATWCPTKKTRINDVAIATATSSRGRMGWYLDGWACPAKTGLLAPLQTSRGGYTACVQDPLGTCYLYQGEDLDFLQGARLRVQTGKKLGYHTGGKAGRTNRAGAWTSYRGEDCKNNQGRD